MSKILVVDDSQTQRQMIVDLLKQANFTVVSAGDGLEALEQLNHFVPDLIVTDVVMPRMNGYQLCRHLKNDPQTRQILAILCSSKSTDVDRYWGLKQGADAYITKPFEPADLIATIKQLLRDRVNAS